MILIDLINSISPISKEAQVDLQNMLVPRFVQKGTMLLTQGEVCAHLHFLEFGFAHQFEWKKKQKQSNYFWEQHSFIAHSVSFLTQTPCLENIEILADSKILSISYEDLQKMYALYPEFNVFGRLMVEKYFVELANVGALIKIKPAHKRYEKLFAERPQLFQQASLGQIASYLNVSIETLSRIRGA